MSGRVARALLVVALLAVGCFPSEPPSTPREIVPGTSGSFTYDPEIAPPVRVYYDAPGVEHLATAPVLVVMHGQSRTARSYRDTWRTYAREHRALLLAPEFTTSAYPGDAYTLGPSSFAVLEPLFAHVIADTRSFADTYLLYGHSAGAQFVHRFLLLQPNRVARSVAANAGWYTAPEFMPWPYGLSGSGASEMSIGDWLAEGLTVLLGTEDTDPNDPDLRHTKEADRQGLHRRARGEYFYGLGFNLAGRRHGTFAWDLAYVDGAGHSNGEMAPEAARILFG